MRAQQGIDGGLWVQHAGIGGLAWHSTRNRRGDFEAGWARANKFDLWLA